MSFIQVLIVIFTGAQDTGKEAALTTAYTTLKKSGVTIYTLGAGAGFVKPEVLWTASHADYVYYNYKYDEIPNKAAPMGQHIKAGNVYIFMAWF